jgi:tetratricopeptide (TPR) repeat protein
MKAGLHLRLGITVAAAVCGFTGLAAGQTTALTAERTWKEWAEAARTHVPGQLDAAARTLAGWTRAELLGAVAALPGNSPDAHQIVGRAIVLHVDIAIGHRSSTGYRLPPGTRATVLLSDGRERAQMLGTYQWEIARRTLERLAPGDERTRMARLFYRATAAVLQYWGEYPELEPHLREAARVIEDDPVLLLYEGTTHQAYAGPRIQQFLSTRRTGETSGPLSAPAPGAGQSGLITDYRRAVPAATQSPSVSAERRRAESLFRRALERDPTLHEARIRLAHMLLDRDRRDEALQELDRATSAPLPPFLEYYAMLLVGRIQLAAGRTNLARPAFDRAAALYPTAQSPRLALSHLAILEFRHREAIDQLPAAVTSEARDDHDPWMLVHRAHAPVADVLLGEMRRELSR